MKALITGASSGIGRDIARQLNKMGIELILSARNENALKSLNKELGGKHKIIVCDLSETENAKKLYEATKNEGIDILVNNAGLGVFGNFSETSLDKELNMIDVNIKAVHILMKLFLKDFVKRDRGYILNTSSSAAFLPGPLLAGYYASKAYVYRLTLAVAKELQKSGSAVKVSVLCPGPVKTNFDNVAGVKFSLKGLESRYVAEYAVKKMFENKTVIIPGKSMQIGSFLTRLIPMFILLETAYHIQKRKK